MLYSANSQLEQQFQANAAQPLGRKRFGMVRASVVITLFLSLFVNCQANTRAYSVPTTCGEVVFGEVVQFTICSPYNRYVLPGSSVYIIVDYALAGGIKAHEVIMGNLQVVKCEVNRRGIAITVEVSMPQAAKLTRVSALGSLRIGIEAREDK